MHLTGTSYTPRVSKKRAVIVESPEGELFEDDRVVGAGSFYGVPIRAGLFRSSSPPQSLMGADRSPEMKSGVSTSEEGGLDDDNCIVATDGSPSA